MIFKPKSNHVAVPGVGLVTKADFSQDHFDACVKHMKEVAKTPEAKEAGLTVDSYIKDYFEVVSYGDLPLFEDEATEAEAEALKKAEEELKLKAEAEAKAEEERLAKEKAEAEELEKLIAEEESKKAK